MIITDSELKKTASSASNVVHTADTEEPEKHQYSQHFLLAVVIFVESLLHQLTTTVPAFNFVEVA